MLIGFGVKSHEPDCDQCLDSGPGYGWSTVSGMRRHGRKVGLVVPMIPHATVTVYFALVDATSKRVINDGDGTIAKFIR